MASSQSTLNGFTGMSLRQAEWAKKPLIEKRRTFRFDRPGRYYSASIEGLPFGETVDRLVAAEKWPFEIEVVATLACTRCRPANRVARRIQAVPAD